MRYFFFVLFFSVVSINSFSQTAKKNYRSSSTELIFSYSLLQDTAGGDFKSNPRFSGFFHQQEQFHFNFGKSVGIYTGIGVRNVGLVTRPTAVDTLGVTKKVRLKQRAYGIGVPLVIKFGNMELKKYIALGAEAEYFFNYKEKVFIDGKKKKSNEWFSDKVNQFNPSVFIEWVDENGVFIRAKYYLYDFLAKSNELLLNETLSVPGYSRSSMLFYISIGINLSAKGKDAYKNVMPKKSSA